MMNLWEAQQVLCRYDPEAIVYIKLPDGRFVVLDHLEDHHPRAREECTCLDTEDEDGNEVLDPRVFQDPHFDPVDPECGKHGDESYRMPAFVTGESHSPEVFHQSEEAECAHTVLDDLGVPRADDGEVVYSLVGRIKVALDKVREATEYEYETTSKKCGHVGVDEASKPTAPEGTGWELVSASCSGNAFWYFWRRLAGSE